MTDKTQAEGTHVVEAEGTFYIRDLAQYECLMSARRMDIADALANTGPRSIREIAEMLGLKTTALYHHIEQMVAVGLIEVAGSRVVNRRREKLYRTPGAVMRYGLSLEDPEAKDIYSRLAAVQCRQAAKDFSRGIGSKSAVGEGDEKNIRVYRLVGSPDKDQLAQINFHLNEIARLFWASAEQAEPAVVISTIMAPIPSPSGD